tara:strand:+ start:32811 stop:34412 length:1602 start_codon:yes stop_codon:yes gene_type:complete
MRQRGGVGMAAGIILSVLVLAGIIAWLLLRPEHRPHREAGSILPADAVMVFSIQPGKLINKAGLPDLLRDNIDLLGGAGMMIDPNQIASFADITRLGIRDDKPVLLFMQPGDMGFVMGLVFPLINRDAFEKGIQENLPGELGDQIIKQMTEEQGLRGIFRGREPIAFGYDDNSLLILVEENSRGDDLGPRVHKLFAQENGLAEARPAFRKFMEKGDDLGLWMDLDAAGELIPSEFAALFSSTPYFPKGEQTISWRFEPGELLMEQVVIGGDALPLRPVDPSLLDVIPANAVLTAVGGIDLAEVDKQVSSLLKDSSRLADILPEDIPLEKVQEFIENLTGGDELDLNEQLTGDLALALTDFELKEALFIKVPLPRLYLAGAFKTREGADMEALTRQFKIGETVGLEAFAGDDRIYLASPKFRESLEESGAVPEPVTGSARNQLTTPSAAMALNFPRLARVLEKFPEAAPAIPLLDRMGTFTATVHTQSDASRFTFRLTMQDRKTNVLRQVIELIMNPASPDPIEEDADGNSLPD